MYHKTVVVGHLGRDPEMRYTPDGIPVTSFSIATTRRWTNANGEPQEKTTWFRVTCWRRLAELAAQYLNKGRLVLVEGEIDASAWLDRSGQPRAALELTATEIRFLTPAAQATNGPAGGQGTNGSSVSATNEDIPF